MVMMRTKECQNIASAIVISFEECNITLLQTKPPRQNQVDQETIKGWLNEIRTQSRSKTFVIVDSDFINFNANHFVSAIFVFFYCILTSITNRSVQQECDVQYM